MTQRPYARVYHEIVDDPKFQRVYDNDAALATWLRMLLIADAMYPASAPMPRRNSAVSLLVEVGLIQERPGNRFVVCGLQAERERRSESARIGAAKRWDNERNANAMPRRDETSKDKTSNGANAPATTFMGWRPKPTDHFGQHPDCAVCEPIRPKESAA
jgi:hypothetical protein